MTKEIQGSTEGLTGQSCTGLEPIVLSNIERSVISKAERIQMTFVGMISTIVIVFNT